MAFNLGAIYADMALRTQKWTQGVNVVVNDSKRLQNIARQNADALNTMALGLAGLGAAAAAGFGFAIRESMNIEEAENLFSVSLGNMADEVRAWSESTADALGLFAPALRETVGTFNVMLGSMGLAPEAAVQMSKDFTKLTADLQSFYNLDHQTAFDKLRAGLTGEAEPLKALGILINETTIQQFAWANGIAKVGEDLTEQQKVVARYGAIMEQTAKAQGDLARTAGSATNQQRLLEANLKKLQITVGDALRPAYASVLTEMNRVLDATARWVSMNPELVAGLVQTTAAASAVAGAIGGIALIGPKVIMALRGIAAAGMVAFAALVSPIGLAAAALATIGAGVYTLRALWIDNFGGMADYLKQWGAALGRVWGYVEAGWSSFIKRLGDQWGGVLGFMADAASAWANRTIGLFMGAFDAVKTIWSGGELGDAIQSASEALTKDYVSFAKTELGELTDYVRNDWSREMVMGFEELVDTLKPVWPVVAEQFKNDLDGMKEYLYAQFPEMKGQVDQFMGLLGRERPGFEGYAPADFEVLMAGARGGDFDKSAAKAGKKAADELKRMADAGEQLYRSLVPSVGVIEDLKKNVEELRAAGRFDAANILGARYWDNIKTQSEETIQSILDGIRKVDALQGTDIAGGVVSAAAQEVLDRIKPESQGMFEQMRTDLQRLKADGQLTPGNMNLLSQDYFDQWRALGINAIEEVGKHLRSLGPDGANMADELNRQLSDQLRAESVERGTDIFAGLGTAQSIIPQLRQDLEDLVNAGHLTEQTGNILAVNVWQNLGNEGRMAFSSIVDELKAKFPEFADVFDQMESRMDGLKKASDFSKVADTFGNLAGILSGLPDEFQDIAKAAQMAQRVMSIAAKASELDWAGVAMEGVALVTEALGLMGDEAEKELKGVDKLFDELGKKIEEWGQEFTDVLVEFIKTGELNFKEFVNSVLEDILRLTIQTTITDPIVGAIQGMFAQGAAFDRGNVVPFAKGGVVSKPTIFPMADGMGLMGEAGPEAVMPLKRMPGGALGVQAQGGGVVVNVNDYRSGGEPVDVQERTGPDGQRYIDITVQDAIERLASNGRLDRALGRNFGVRRRPV